MTWTTGLLLLAGFAALLVGADLLVRGASRLAAAFVADGDVALAAQTGDH